MGTDELTDRGRDLRPDGELLRLAGERDEAALRLLFDRHAHWLRLRRRCADDEVVDHALQDTFVAVWTRPGGFRGDGEVAAWRWGIAIRRLISRLRRHRAPVPSPVEMMF
ncbi:MAG: sigma factor [Terracoccus sp.]